MLKKGPVRVMIIDDDQEIRDIFSEIFGEEKFDIFAAENGLVAIEEMKKNDYDLAFIDIYMPGINGLETLRQLKEINENLKTVMISGFSNEALLEKSLEIGADDYLYKPLDIQDILGVALKYTQQLGVQNHVQLIINDFSRNVTN